MTWTIDSWDERNQTGTVRSPHYGPFFFSREENPRGTAFVVGEEVGVTLLGSNPPTGVTRVTALRIRHPPGTGSSEFDWINERRFMDAHVETRNAWELVLWVGNCCRWCSDGAQIRFSGERVALWDSGGTEIDCDEIDFSESWFRLASDGEVEALALPRQKNRRIICLVPNYGHDPDADLVFVSCEMVSIIRLHHIASPHA